MPYHVSFFSLQKSVSFQNKTINENEAENDNEDEEETSNKSNAESDSDASSEEESDNESSKEELDSEDQVCIYLCMEIKNLLSLLEDRRRFRPFFLLEIYMVL